MNILGMSGLLGGLILVPYKEKMQFWLRDESCRARGVRQGLAQGLFGGAR